MEQTPSYPVVKKKQSKALKIIPWVGLVLFILTVAAGVYLYTTKQLVLNIGTGSATTSLATVVCGDDIATTYNAASKLEVRNNGTDLTADVDGLNTLDKEIRAKSGFDQDPTCQTILFWNAVSNDNNAAAQTALNAIQKLHDNHQYANSDLDGTTSISTMKDTLSALSTDTKG